MVYVSVRLCVQVYSNFSPQRARARTALFQINRLIFARPDQLLRIINLFKLFHQQLCLFGKVSIQKVMSVWKGVCSEEVPFQRVATFQWCICSSL